MTIFSKLPKTQYLFTGNNLATIPNLFRHVKVVERRIDAVSIYQKYFIKDQRPDQVSYELYGSTDFHWTLMLVNDRLRSGMNKWPLRGDELQNFIADKYAGYTITPYRLPADALTFNSIAGKFAIGSTITGSSSGATATITARNSTLNQIVFTYDSDATFSEGVDTFTAVTPSGVVSQLLNTQYDIRTYANSVHHYEDANGVTYYNDENLRITSGFKTNTEYEEELNEERNEIRVIKPQFIQQFSAEFRRLINE